MPSTGPVFKTTPERLTVRLLCVGPVERTADFIQQAFGLAPRDADSCVELNLVYGVWPVQDLVERVVDRKEIVLLEVCSDRPVNPSADDLHASKDMTRDRGPALTDNAGATSPARPGAGTVTRRRTKRSSSSKEH